MRNGEKILSDLRWKLARWEHNDSLRALFAEQLVLLEPLAYAPERHSYRSEECETCLGSGYVAGHENDCPVCDGSGYVFVFRACNDPDCYQCNIWPPPSNWLARPSLDADRARIRQLSLLEPGNEDVPF
jgi:hypothetical protein